MIGNSKGQLSIEFILILTVIILMLQVILVPLRDYAVSNTDEISRLAQIESLQSDIVYHIDMMDKYDDVNLEYIGYLPKDTNLFITDDGMLEYSILFNSNMDTYDGCNQQICSKSYVLLFETSGFIITQEGKYLFQFIKNDSGNQIIAGGIN